MFLQSRSPVSKRIAILEDNGKVAFLYLTEPNVSRPLRDAIVYSRIPPVKAVDWDRIRKTGETPLLTTDIASPTAVIPSPRQSEFTFKWSEDGEAVAVLRQGVPLAFVSIKARLGYSKAVVVASPLVNVWDQQLYSSLFER